MKKMTLKPIIMSALAALAFGTVSVGTTFALFTDKAETKINVKAGVVDVDNEISIKEVKELGGVDAVKDANEDLYTNSIGSTTELLSNKAVKLTNWVPGDKAVFTINSVNKSNVNIKTRFTVKHTSSAADKDLYPALTISYKALDEINQDIGYKFMDWNLLPAVSEADLANGGKVISKVEVTIEFADDGDKTIRERTEGLNNGYQGKDCEIIFTQEAVQGNASVKSKIEEMNALLAAEPTPNKTMHEALSDVGSVMDASQLLTVGYVWNAETDRFAYPEEATQGNKYKYFKVYGEMPAVADQEFSVYAYGTGWTTTAVNLNGIGFDAGTVSGIASVSYTNDSDSREVVIRTNSFDTTLTINAPKDTVKHFGDAKKVDVIAIANASYHENGTVKLIAVKEGHVKLEGEADVNGVYVYTNNASAGFEDIKITVDAGVEIPTLSRSAVEVKDGGTKVCTVVTDQAKDIYLFNEGIYEQIKAIDHIDPADYHEMDAYEEAVTTALASSAWVDETNSGASINTQTAAQQLANEWNGAVAPTWSEENNSTRKLTDIENLEEALGVEAGASAEEIAQAIELKVDSTGTSLTDAEKAAMFKGEGTESSPYEINNGNDWYNLLTRYQGLYMGSSTNGLYVVLKGDIDMAGYDISSYNSYPRNFHLDGNGFTMKNFETSIWGDDGTLYLTNTFTNLKLDNCHSSNNSLFGGTQNSNTASVTFNNVDLNNCSAVGGAYQYYDGSATATFIDCDATNTNVLGGYMASGGFVGNISTGVIAIDHCSFGGSVVSTESACGGFIGQSANYDPNKITIKDSTILAGTVIRNVAGGSVAAFNAHTGTQDYAQFNNSFYGTLETTGTKYKQGTNAAEKTYEPICTAADFTLNSVEGTLTYNGSAGLGKIAVQVYVIDDYIYNGTYYGGYNYYVCDPIKANNIVNGTTISGIPVITDFYNVVSSTSTPVGLQTTDTTYIDEIHNGVFYYDAQTYSWGHYMLGGTYKNGSAVEPTSLNVYIKITVYDNSDALIGVVSGATLKYTVDLSNHGN